MTEQAILEAVQEIFRDNFDDDTLEITSLAVSALRIMRYCPYFLKSG